MEPLHVVTPVWESIPLRRKSGKRLYLKMDCFQPTGAFKTRGIGLLCQKYVKEGYTQLISSSGGNAGYAAAYAGRKLGVHVTVFVPSTTLSLFKDKIRSQGAEVVVSGNNFDEAAVAAKEFVEKTGGGYVPPYDHPAIWEGNSTIMDEVVEQIDEKPEGVLLSVGGGGLLCGVLDGMHRHGWEDVPVYGVEALGAKALVDSVKAGERVTLPSVNTIATSIAAKTVAQRAFDWTKEHEVVPMAVSDRRCVEAVHSFLNDHRVLVEPACGAALSAIYDDAKELRDKKSLLVIVCGGVGISYEQLGKFMEEVPESNVCAVPKA